MCHSSVKAGKGAGPAMIEVGLEIVLCTLIPELLREKGIYLLAIGIRCKDGIDPVRLTTLFTDMVTILYTTTFSTREVNVSRGPGRPASGLASAVYSNNLHLVQMGTENEPCQRAMFVGDSGLIAAGCR